MLKQNIITLLSTAAVLVSCNTKSVSHTEENSHDCASTDSKNIITLISLTSDTVYEEGIDIPLLKNVRVVGNGHLMYQNKSTIFEEGSERKFQYKDSVLYFLLREYNPTTLRTLHVLRCSNDGEVEEMIVEGQLVQDIDDDSILEVIGQEYTEAACLECDSSTYSPVRVYKLGINCSFDKELSEELTILKYGCYLGDQCQDTILENEVIKYNGILLW